MLQHAWVSYVALAIFWLIPRGEGEREPFVASAAGAVVFSTLVTHAVFFGAGRYSLVVVPLVCGAAALALERRPRAPVAEPAPEGSPLS